MPTAVADHLWPGSPCHDDDQLPQVGESLRRARDLASTKHTHLLSIHFPHYSTLPLQVRVHHDCPSDRYRSGADATAGAEYNFYLKASSRGDFCCLSFHDSDPNYPTAPNARLVCSSPPCWEDISSGNFPLASCQTGSAEIGARGSVPDLHALMIYLFIFTHIGCC